MFVSCLNLYLYYFTWVSGSREQAYIYSISSAGVMHALIKSCANGQLEMCGCNTNIRTRDTKGKFVWGGCSHDIDYGQRFARDFIDSKEDSHDPVGLMNIWNNGAGRKVRRKTQFFYYYCIIQYYLTFYWY